MKRRGYALWTLNGDQDRPYAFKPLQDVLTPLGISHELITPEDTDHILGKYYERGGDVMLDFLARCLRTTAAGQDSSIKKRVLSPCFHPGAIFAARCSRA